MRTLAALTLAALAAGCNIGNDTVLVGTLVQSPSAPAGFASATTTQVTVAEVFLAHVDTGLGSPPTQSSMRPISGATVKVVKTPTTGLPSEFPLVESPLGSGNYESTNVVYAAGATFRFVAQVGSDQYWGEVAGAPAAPAFTLNGSNPLAIPNYSTFPANVLLNRTCSGVCNVGIYGVWPVPNGGTYNGSGNPSCTNMPSDAAGILNLAFLDDLAWRANPFTLYKASAAQTCFPPLGSTSASYPGGYVVGLADLKKGTLSSNVSPFSAVYVGASGAGAITVAAP